MAAGQSVTNDRAHDFSFLEHIAPLLANGGARAEGAAGALITICKNILHKPGELRYRRLPSRGAAFTARVASCPGALDVLLSMGFTEQRYPDQDYWVLHQVNSQLLHSILRELEIFEETAAKLRIRRHLTEASESVSEHALDGQDGDTDPPRLDSSGSEIRRQLAARAVVHRVAATQLRNSTASRRQSMQLAVLFFLSVMAMVAAVHHGAHLAARREGAGGSARPR